MLYKICKMQHYIVEYYFWTELYILNKLMAFYLFCVHWSGTILSFARKIFT